MIFPFDPEAEVAYLQLQELGFKVPQEISLLSFGGTRRENALLHRLSSLVVDEYELGRRAGELLHEMRSGVRPLDDNETVTSPLGLYAGATLGPAPGR